MIYQVDKPKNDGLGQTQRMNNIGIGQYSSHGGLNENQPL